MLTFKGHYFTTPLMKPAQGKTHETVLKSKLDCISAKKLTNKKQDLKLCCTRLELGGVVF